MMRYIKYIMIGIIIGIAKVIPGVSGAVLAISFGIYDRGLNAITHFFNDLKNNFVFLLSIAIGLFIGITCFSKIINYMLNNYYIIVMLCFTGLVLGGTPIISKKIDKTKVNFLIAILSCLIIFTLGISNIDNNYIPYGNNFDYIIYFISGIVEAIGTVIPGISSTALLMIIGIYNIFINFLSNITSIDYFMNNLDFIINFSLGLILGTIIISIIMDYLFCHYQNKTYAFILGISIGSIFLMLGKSFIYSFTIIELIIGLILFIIGFIISYCLSS